MGVKGRLFSKGATDLGIELYIMDDGWFGQRDDDNTDAINRRVIQYGIEANPEPVHIRVQGLKEQELYKIELLNMPGLTIPPAWREYQTFQIHIEHLERQE